MLTLRSILQHICQFFRGLAVKATKRMYRSSAVFMAGAAVITVVAFTSTGFGSGGRNALTAFAETPGQETAAEEEDAEEEEPVTEAKVQVQLTEIKKQGQLLAGNLLEKEVQQKQEIQQDSKVMSIPIISAVKNAVAADLSASPPFRSPREREM